MPLPRTYVATPKDIVKNWFVIDAADLVLGRLASLVAMRVRGKHKATYTPNMDCGDHIIIVNAEKLHLTGNKRGAKTYYWHTGYPGGIKETTPEKLSEKKPGEVLKLAEKLDRYGIKIMGTSFESLDLAEDRGSFSTLLKNNDIPYPEFGVAETADEALALADELNFPILVRPSYVLGGQGMKIVINKEELVKHVVDLLHKIPNNKLLLDHYLDGAIEAEADAICDGEDVYIIGIMEHIEPCGIHSGDSNATLPPFNSVSYTHLRAHET